MANARCSVSAESASAIAQIKLPTNNQWHQINLQLQSLFPEVASIAKDSGINSTTISPLVQELKSSLIS